MGRHSAALKHRTLETRVLARTRTPLRVGRTSELRARVGVAIERRARWVADAAEDLLAGAKAGLVNVGLLAIPLGASGVLAVTWNALLAHSSL